MRRSALFMTVILLAACGGSLPAPVAVAEPAASSIDDAVSSITAADVQRRVEYLASDELRGRDTPSPGLEAAARYAADEFRRMGLQPAAGSDFIRRFGFDASRLDRNGVRFEARTRSATRAFTYAAEYFVIPARVDSVTGTPIFVGTAGQGGMPPANAAGRPLMFFVPDTAMAAWQMAAGAAVQSAMAGRAGAVVLVLDPDFSTETIGTLAGPLAGQIMPMPMPIFGVSYAAAQQMLQAAGHDLDRLRTASAPTELATTLSIATPIGGSEVQVPNVVAVLPGGDPELANEYVVFSAHFDHDGVGTPTEAGDSIYNGADDNASGTAAVMEIAEAFALLEPRPRRSLMFVLVSAEEKGLVGSEHFVNDPPVPVTQMVANINMDMVGRNAPDTVVAIGQDYSSLGPTVQRVRESHPELGLVVAPDLWPEEQLFFRSDHFSFAAKEIPAIFFTTGLHDDYHKPTDEAQHIDNDKIMRISRLLFRTALDIANAPDRPQWTAEGLAEVRRVTGGQ
jgi:hypothetical protein